MASPNDEENDYLWSMRNVRGCIYRNCYIKCFSGNYTVEHLWEEVKPYAQRITGSEI